MIAPSPRTVAAATTSAAQTRALAAEVAALAEPTDIIVLAGEMGSGKTVWVQGFAHGLGVAEQVTSPTFTLMRPYQGKRLTLLHVDVYRLDSLTEVVDLGVIEQLDGQAVACIEWGDLAEPALPADFLEVRLEHGDADGTDDNRRLSIRPVGVRWHRRLDAVRQAVAPWAVAS